MTSHWLVWPVWEVILSTCKMCYVFRSFWGTFKGLLWTSMKWVWNIKGMQFLFFFLIWRRTVHRFIKVSSSVVFPWNGKQRPPVASVTSFTKKSKKRHGCHKSCPWLSKNVSRRCPWKPWKKEDWQKENPLGLMLVPASGYSPRKRTKKLWQNKTWG